MKKKNTVTTVLLTVLTIILYAIQFGIYSLGMISDSGIGEALSGVMGVLVLILMVVSVILIFANIINALILVGSRSGYEGTIAGNAKKIFIFKLLLIPFYILNFFNWGMIMMALLIVPGLQLFLGIILVGVVWTYGILLSTTAYGAGIIWKMCKRKQIPMWAAVCLMILQFIFVVDIIGYMVFYLKYRKALVL